MKKRVLVLTSRMGGGHESVAQALVDYIKSKQIATVKKVDLMREANKMVEAIWVQTYKTQVSATPTIYDAIYELAREDITGGIDGFFKLFLYKALRGVYEKFRPDTIIITHPFQVPPTSRLKQKINPDLQIIEVVTDFEPHSLHVNDSIDKYIVASDFTKHVLIARGMPADKIFTYGIPVRMEFTKEIPTKNESESLRLLVLGGSLGTPEIKSTVRQILSDDSRNVTVVVVCGRNRYLKKTMEQTYSTDARVTVKGFVDNVCELMDWADVVVTKPGGLTITEAIYRQKPLLVPYSYPGQERENLQFLLENDLVVYVKSKRKIGEVIDELIADQSRLRTITRNLGKLRAGYSIEKILELI
ncbi:MAG: MGDG synthase family glycosyltransferase [Candidatus Nanosyncoccaceae bacterium]